MENWEEKFNALSQEYEGYKKSQTEYVQALLWEQRRQEARFKGELEGMSRALKIMAHRRTA